MATLVSIRNSINTKDPFYEEEQAFFDKNMTVVSEIFNILHKKLLASKHIDKLKEEFGELLFKQTEVYLKTFKPEIIVYFFFSSRRRHTRWTGDWSSDVCSSDLGEECQRTIENRPDLERSGSKHYGSLDQSAARPRRSSRGRSTGLWEWPFNRGKSARSEERRVGKECRSRWWTEH